MADDADLLGIGEHCCYQSCGQVDFLPFKCDCCKLTYCLEHRTYSAHACTKANGKTTEVILCPICAKGVKLVVNEDVNTTFDRHTATDCDPSNYSKVHRKPKCPAKGCKDKLTTINAYACKSCGTRVCLRHRLPDDHQCKAQQDRPLAAALDRQQNGGMAGTSMLSNWFSSTTSTSKPAPVTAAQQRVQQQRARALSDPGNTVMGTAARRRQQVDPTPAAPTTALPTTGGTEVCPQCRATFRTVAELIQHAEDYHPTAAAGAAAGGAGARGRAAAGGFVCTKCGQAFADAVQLVSHDERQHSGRTPAQRSECVVS